MPVYRVSLQNHKHGAVGHYLSCHGTVSTDKRGNDSCFTHVNTTHFGDLWEFRPVHDELCTFKIRLANPSHGAIGTYLSAHRTVGGDKRSGDSTYAHVNHTDYGDEWKLIPVPERGNNAFRIMLSQPKHGVVGRYLNAHRTVSGQVLSDKRGGDSTYVHVNENDDGSFWRLERR